MLLSVNPSLINKGELHTHEANYSFENQELTIPELAGRINLGHAFTSQLKGKRCSDNFLAAGFAALDFDQWTLAEAEKNSFIQQYAALIYTTPSHQSEGKGDRFRVVFELVEPLYEIQKYRRLLEGLLELFPQADTVAKDPTRIWFGSKGSNPKVMGRILSKLVMEDLLTRGKDIIAAKEARKKDCSYELPLEEVTKMLTYIDPQPGYEIWRSICFALGNAFEEEEAIATIEEWSPDDKHSGKHLRQLIRRADGRTTLRTVAYHACKGGYTLPERLSDFKRSPEQVALEDIFNRGHEYITIGNELYVYNGTYYKRLERGYCLKLVADYFYTYQTDEHGKKGFVSDKKIKDALNFVLAKLYVDPLQVNPPGLNLKNGTLKLSYNGKKPTWKLIEHTSAQYYTYVADFDYDPNADTSLVQKALNDILDPPQLVVFMRTISAMFDLPTVRKLQGRAVKALILLGVGSNGKDTLRVWTELLVGEHGLTTVGLKDFVKADNSSRFGLHSLTSSLINWASENDVVALDKCQSLKNFVTGDPITIEKKHKDDIVIKPKAVGIFNANEAPHISSTQEAIASRYAFLDFPNKFVQKPRSDFPREKQGDPRYKEDPGFIKAEILPGYLLLLMQAFAELCREGIDTRCTESAIESVRRDSNHFYQFMQETQLVPCPLEEGLTPSEIHFRYEGWCKDNGMLTLFSEGRKVWNEPSKYDPLVKNVRDITKRLYKEIPDLVKDRNNRGRKVGVKFLDDTVF